MDLFPQVKSAKHMAKLNLVSVSDRVHFPIYLENSIKNLENVYETFINTYISSQ